MKPNQTSVRGNVQDVLLPMECFRCLQGDFEGNHPYYAVDLSGRDTGRDFLYAPVDVTCMATNPSDGNAVWWQSQSKVRFADGTIGFLTIMILHDNNLDGIYPGVSYRQGQQIAQEGTAGMTNGNHLHVEFAKGPFTKCYAKNATGYYLPNGIAIETVCFADNTKFITSSNWNWKYTKDVPVKEEASSIPSENSSIMSDLPSDFIRENATFVCGVKSIKIRKAPSLNGADTNLRYTNGQLVIYEGYVKREGYVWITWISASTRERRWMAVRDITTNDAYGTFR